MLSKLRAIFFDAGNTLIYPHTDQLAEDLTAQGYPATTMVSCTMRPTSSTAA